MKYYTKEWYELMQNLHHTSGLQKIPDKVYSDREIQLFYDADLAAEVAHDEELYNTPPDYGPYETLLKPDVFQPHIFFFVDEETGETFHPETPETARQYIERELRRRKEAFEKRPPFDPAETVKCFETCYKGMLRYGVCGYPQWVRDTVDPRLLALNRIPETAYDRLKKEETENQKAFDRIMSEAEKELNRQDIPERIRSQFCFHDACLLALKKNGADRELYLRKDGGWFGETTPYIRIVFRNVYEFEREKGFALRIKRNDEGEMISGCRYLYDELYRTEKGYEIHLLLAASESLRYLTICCEDIVFYDNIEDWTVSR